MWRLARFLYLATPRDKARSIVDETGFRAGNLIATTDEYQMYYVRMKCERAMGYRGYGIQSITQYRGGSAVCTHGRIPPNPSLCSSSPPCLSVLPLLPHDRLYPAGTAEFL